MFSMAGLIVLPMETAIIMSPDMVFGSFMYDKKSLYIIHLYSPDMIVCIHTLDVSAISVDVKYDPIGQVHILQSKH